MLVTRKHHKKIIDRLQSNINIQKRCNLDNARANNRLQKENADLQLKIEQLEDDLKASNDWRIKGNRKLRVISKMTEGY